MQYLSDVVLPSVLAVVALVLLLPACANLWWMLHAWRTPETHAGIAETRTGTQQVATFSVIVPFRHEEEAVVRATVERLLAQTYGWLEVVLSVGHDDPEAVDIAGRLSALDPGRTVISVDRSPVKNKPRQLNTALRACVGDYVVIFDAESQAHPELLAHVDTLLAETGCDVLQSGVQLINHRTSWYSLRNCMEYFFWFRSRLHLHARHGFIPLGGNTVFLRRSLLMEVGGWDEDALTEDCELGVRLSSRGVTVAVTYDPRLATREECPDTVRALIKQRSRWNQGFLQVLAKGDWRQLPTRSQRLLARFTLLQPYFLALTFVAFPMAVAAALFSTAPLPITMITFLPLVPTLGSLMFEAVALREFGRELKLPIGPRDHARLVLSTLPYQVLLGYAAGRAMVRHVRGHDNWEKTPHAGHHLVPALSGAAA